MTFTDDDLKILKENMPYWAISTQSGSEKQSGPGNLRGLLARLEAAEAIAEDYGLIYPNDPATLRWRKAAGR